MITGLGDDFETRSLLDNLIIYTFKNTTKLWQKFIKKN